MHQQITGQYKKCRLMDGTEKIFETAIISVDTPYIKQRQMAVMCVENLEVDLIIGNIQGARCECDPDSTWKLKPIQQKQ